MRPHLFAIGAAWLLMAPAADAVPAPTRQGWAHEDQVVDLKPNRRGYPSEAIDRLMIQEVFSRWGIAFDEGRADVIASLFDSDGVLETLEGSGTPTLTVKGAQQIGAAMAGFQKKQGDQRRHAMTNVVIESLGGGKAVALAYSIVTATTGGKLFLASSVIYRGELAKGADGVWRFSRFVIGMDIYVRDEPQIK